MTAIWIWFSVAYRKTKVRSKKKCVREKLTF